MSSDRVKVFEQIDGLKTSVAKLADELETAKRQKAEADSKLTRTVDEVSSLKEKLAQSERTSGVVDSVTKERDELKAEMAQITEQLQRVSELYREASTEKDKLKEKVDVSDLLAIYITLIETVFGGKPHARVLYTLHNTKTAITRKNLESSTGIMSTAIMKAIHDLRNAQLVSYDEEATQEVRLIKDIF
ncbi:MAG: hypothetical protein C4K49_10950 [Candidatus Thorarchaeota archaeon]|nr:MAG: hypothetical protein C4K49_10950 [Candidatus Thorarchaeota archaeon]